MTYVVAVLGFVLLSVALWDAFEVIISPRRVTHRFRLTRAFYRSSWWLWSAVARSIGNENRRESYLGIFGPLSLVMLLGVWAIAIVAGFAMMHWGLESRLNVAPGIAPFSTYLYMSGTTFFTLGLGDVTPLGAPGRALVVLEAGMGFGEILLVNRLSERTATIDEQRVRQPIGAFGVQTVLLLGLSVHGSAEQVPCQPALVVESPRCTVTAPSSCDPPVNRFRSRLRLPNKYRKVTWHTRAESPRNLRQEADFQHASPGRPGTINVVQSLIKDSDRRLIVIPMSGRLRLGTEVKNELVRIEP